MNKHSDNKDTYKFILDIGVNLTDSMYQGEYHGSKKHQPDLDLVLDRAWKHGLDRMMVTGGSLEDAKEVLKICQTSSKSYFKLWTFLMYST